MRYTVTYKCYFRRPWMGRQTIEKHAYTNVMKETPTQQHLLVVVCLFTTCRTRALSHILMDLIDW